MLSALQYRHAHRALPAVLLSQKYLGLPSGAVEHRHAGRPCFQQIPVCTQLLGSRALLSRQQIVLVCAPAGLAGLQYEESFVSLAARVHQ